MKIAIFVLPFNSVTRETDCPAPEWVHKTPESGETVIAEVRGEDAIIDAMIADPTYLFLEDVE